MRSAGLFLALMVTGVVIVLIYIWSGESLVVLTLTILTLFAGLALADRKPWAAAEETESRRIPAPRRPPPVWRSGHDVTCDARGLTGVPVGQQAPRLWAWSQIDDLSRGWCSSTPKLGFDRDGVVNRDQPVDERIGLQIDVRGGRDGQEPTIAVVAFGPEQHPDRVVRDAREVWRDYRVTRSRLYHLAPQDRTRRLASDIGRTGIDLQDPDSSPELLFQELRRTLLGRGELCRLDLAGDVGELLDEFDQMLSVAGVEPLTDDEADELFSFDGPDRLESIVWSLDWAAEQRGYRLAFLEQVHSLDEPTGEDGGSHSHVIGLLPADIADEWDGQLVGSGSARVILDLPRRI